MDTGTRSGCITAEAMGQLHPSPSVLLFRLGCHTPFGAYIGHLYSEYRIVGAKSYFKSAADDSCRQATERERV